MKTYPFTWGRAWLGAIFLSVGFAEGSSAQTALLNYTFNQTTGTTASSTGTDSGPDAALTLYNASGVATDLYGTSPQGSVSGASGDGAIHLNASAMGNFANQGPVAATASGISGLSSSTQSFTIAGWYNASTQLANLGRVFALTDGSTGGFQVWGTAGGATTTLTFQNETNSQSVTSTASSIYAAANSWVFYAVTVDNSTKTVDFYAGTTSATAILMGTASLTSAVTFDSSLALYLGNSGIGTTNGNRPFDGYMDDVSVYAASNGTGALSLAQIDAVQMSAVPEPSVAVLLVLGGMGVAWGLRRESGKGLKLARE